MNTDMKNDANLIGKTLKKYISKYDLERERPKVRTQLIYYYFSKLSLKTGPAAYSQERPMVQKYGKCILLIKNQF
jgi:hypothetical protein